MMTAAKLRLAQAAMGQPGTKVGELCAELGVSRQTLYRHVDHGAHSEPMARSFLGEPIGRIGQPPARRQFLQPPFDLPAVSVLNEDGRHAGCGRLRRSSTVIGFILDETRFSSRSPAGVAIGPRNAPAIL